MTRFVSIVATLAVASVASAQQALIYVPEDVCTSRGGVTPLDRLSDETLCEFTPIVGARPAANKIVSLANWTALLGDDDADGEFFESSLGEVDALALHPKFKPNPFGNPELFDMVFSSEDDFGSSWSVPGNDGELWRLVRGAPAGGPVIKVFLSEKVLQAGVGTTDSVDVDALAFDPTGTMYLSFRDDELIHGDIVPLQNGAIIAFPAPLITYDAAGNITSLGSDTVQVVLNEPDVDVIVGSIGLDDGTGSGTIVTTIGDLQALDVDPAGGTFIGADGITLWPNLFFAGSDIGPRVLTTSGGGAIATLNGAPLGDVGSTSGAYLGLDLTGSDVASLLVIPDRDDPLIVDLDGQGLDAVDLTDVLWVGNGFPFGFGLLVASVGPSAAGSNFPALPLAHKYRFPALYAAPWFTSFVFPFDIDGRFPLPFALPPGIVGDLNILVQVFDLTFPPFELSAPVNIAYDG